MFLFLEHAFSSLSVPLSAKRQAGLWLSTMILCGIWSLWALILLPSAYFLIIILLPFAVPWIPFEYEVGLDYWDAKYKKQFHTSGISEARGHTPPVYSNGWWKLCDSYEVPTGQHVNVRFRGQDVVVFRGDDGKIGVVDAYCPHLGAHLGIGGKVVGNCLECPFHGWQFDAEGKCRSIPYSPAAIPSQARVATLGPIEERLGAVLLWTHAEGEEPSWYLDGDAWPPIPASYRQVGRVRHHINCHVAEVPENGADVAHLAHLHGPAHPLMRRLPITFRWTADWNPGPSDRPHTADVSLTEELLWRGKPVGFVSTEADIRQLGPGMVVLGLKSAFGHVVLVQSLTSVEPYHQRLDTVMWASGDAFNLTLIARLMLLGYAENVERDVLIWNRKRNYRAPLLVKGDGPIGRFRKWYQQFYTPNSPTWKSIQEAKRDANELNW
jgi:cholesterol 7-dehydrogenase